jgi:hypothetical protein
MFIPATSCYLEPNQSRSRRQEHCESNAPTGY